VDAERKSRTSCRCFLSSSSKLRHFGKLYDPKLCLSYESRSHERTKIGQQLISDSMLFSFSTRVGGKDKRRLQNASILRLVLPTYPLRSPGEGKRASENLWVSSTCVVAGGRAGGTTRDGSWSMGLVDVHYRTSKIAASRESEEWNNGLKPWNKGHVLLCVVHS
jgi:hypothetical protein